MAQIPKLPQEVVEKIIDFVATQLDNPNPELWSCALTCRAFRIRSQFRIHQFVSISNGLDATCVFQRYRNSALATYVRKLSLAGGPHDGDSFFQSRWRPLLGLLPMLEVVELNNVKHRLRLSPETFSPRYTTISSLALWQIYVPTCHTILRLLETLPNLSNISLMRSSWSCDGGPSAVLPSIRKLEIHCTESLTGLACLNSHLDFSGVQSAHLYWYGDRELRQVKMDSEPVLDLVRKAATSLREVDFGIRFFPPFRVVPDHTDLSSNTNLEALTIGVVYLVWEPLGVPDFGWLPNTLQCVTSNRFRHFKIQIRIENTIQFSYIPWDRVDAILSSPNFPSFQQLTIELSSRSSMPWRGLEYEGELTVEKVLPVARRHLPNLSARGALTVMEAPPN